VSGTSAALRQEAVEELCERVRAAFDVPRSWHDRIWAGGLAAMRWLREDPERARLLAAEASRGDGASMRSRAEAVQGIADLLDSGRDEHEGPRPMSRCTAEIAAGALFNTMLAKVASGSVERGEEFLPELIYMATMPYLGARAAEDELAVQPLR
jgi:hypothetical protein